MKKLILMIGVALLLISCGAINSKLGLQDDNFAEEVMEDVIKEKSGLDLDFTPLTPEQK